MKKLPYKKPALVRIGQVNCPKPDELKAHGAEFLRLLIRTVALQRLKARIVALK